ncbi:MAG: DUF1254 domain-containing protein [Parachlamydiales bacterium]|jgi:hypothetical protein
MKILSVISKWSLLALVFTACNTQSSEDKEKDVIKEAYIYGYPLVIMDVTKEVMTAAPNVTETKAPVNQFDYIRKFPSPTSTDVVSPNADTLYSSAWLDLSKEPIIFVVPEMKDRYYLYPILDAWTNVFTSIGTRTTGSDKGTYAIVGPDWRGNLPKDVKKIQSPTNTAWMIGRIETNGPSDYAAVNKLQDQFKLIPLSSYGSHYVPPKNLPVEPYIDVNTPPVKQVEQMDGITFFTNLTALLKNNPPLPADSSFVRKLASIGIVPGEVFDVKKLTPEQLENLDKSITEAKTTIANEFQNMPNAKKVNGWNIMTEYVGDYGTHYLIRAAVANKGLGANLSKDAVYPTLATDAEGNPLDGSNRYILHFTKDQIPPVNGFWSITMYNDKQFFVPNPLDRYAIGDRSHLKINPDGSLDIYIQNTSPGKDKESNWLPAPKGGFNLIMRLYDPKEAVLDGKWNPPAIKKLY